MKNVHVMFFQRIKRVDVRMEKIGRICTIL